MSHKITPDILGKIKEMIQEGFDWSEISLHIPMDYTTLRVQWRRYVNSLSEPEREALRKECLGDPAPEPGWKRVAEAVPEIGQEVLVFTTKKDMAICFFDVLDERDLPPLSPFNRKAGDIVWKSRASWYYQEHVTHWMPLPGAPRE